MSSDVCNRKHGGDPESVAAHRASAVHAEADRLTILELIAGRIHGLTLDEACIAMNREPNQLSGRMTELKQKGAIIANGMKRPTRTGCLAKAYVIAPPPAPKGSLF
jgi:hypothetical protein